MDDFMHEYDPAAAVPVRTHGFEFLVTPRYRERYATQSYEPLSTEIVRHYTRADGTFLDVGAHYGYYALLAAHVHPSSRVIAVEPVRETFQLLEKNLQHIPHRTLFNVAASDTRGRKPFQVTEASDSASFYDHPGTRTIEHRTIETVPLDDLLEQTDVDFVKIDVEGHELAVLRGLTQTLKRSSAAALLVEFYPLLQERATGAADVLLRELDARGYDIVIIDDEHRKLYRLTGNRHPWQRLGPFASSSPDAHANLLCIPKDRALYTVFFSHSAHLAGAERGLLSLTQDLRQQRALSHMVVPSEGPLTEALQSSAVTHDVVPMSWWASRTEIDAGAHLDSLRHVAEYVRELERMNPHVIYTNTTVIPWGALAAFLVQKPHIWHIYEFGERDHGLHYDVSLEETLKLISATSAKVIFCSRAVERACRAHIDPRKGTFLYYSIRVPEALIADAGHADPFRPTDAFKLIIVGSVNESKGQDQAVRAVLELRQEGMSVALLILGPSDERDPYVQALQATISAHPDGGVTFAPFVANPFPLMHRADALLMCSRCEALGRVTIEAMLLGKAVIGANTGGTTELITDGVTGLLYEHGNIKDLKRAIRQLASDSKRCQHLGAAARVFARARFAENNFAHRVYALCKGAATSEDAAENIPLTARALATLLFQYAAPQGEATPALKHEQQLHDVLASRSWKITAPLRSLKRIVTDRKTP